MKEFNIQEAVEELTSESGAESEASTETPSLEGQPENGANENQEQEMSTENIFQELEKEQNNPEAHAALLEQINSLGMIFNGQPLKIESPDQLKELVQKGFDYTKKTMAHAEEVKAKNEEFAQMEAKFKQIEEQLQQREVEHNEILRDSEIFTNLIMQWKTSDPDLYDYLAKAYSGELSKYGQTQLIAQKYDGKIKELNDKFAKLEQVKTQENLSKIKQSWESELSEVQTKTGGYMAKLGVKVDWDKVKQAWMADATNSMSVENALHAVYGKDIAKAYESHKKLMATKNKTQASLLSRSGVGSPSKGAEPSIKIAPGDYEKLLTL